MTNEKNLLLCLYELESLDDKHHQAQQQINLYQARISRALNKNDKEQIFKKDDLILAVRRPMIMKHKTKRKFKPKWEWPFIVESIYLNGVIVSQI